MIRNILAVLWRSDADAVDESHDFGADGARWGFVRGFVAASGDDAQDEWVRGGLSRNP
ncbi:MAG: hypothetical protein ABSE36_14085 [Terracidiphilus sp.]